MKETLQLWLDSYKLLFVGLSFIVTFISNDSYLNR